MTELQEKINKIQMLEQNIQAVSAQKQQIQTQQIEIDSALKEIENSEETYKIVANVLIKTPKEKLKQDLDEKKKIVDLRLQTLDKQEKQFKEKIKELQQEVLKERK